MSNQTNCPECLIACGDELHEGIMNPVSKCGSTFMRIGNILYLDIQSPACKEITRLKQESKAKDKGIDELNELLDIERARVYGLEQSIAEDAQHNESMEAVGIENEQLRDRIEELEKTEKVLSGENDKLCDVNYDLSRKVEELENERGPLKEMREYVSMIFRKVVRNKRGTKFLEGAYGMASSALITWAEATAKAKRGIKE